jgi:two-component system, LytTR family, response regulator
MAATCYQQPLATPPRSRIRAAIADHDPERRSLLRRAVLGDHGFDLVAEAVSFDEVAGIVESELPELVIGSLCETEYSDAEQPFPVLITVGGSGSILSKRVVGDVPIPLREADVAEALATATGHILHLKARELSSLVHSYLNYCDDVRSPLRHITVEDGGRQISIRTEDILWIKADGNYVQLYTAAGSFELRDTLSHIAAKLEASGFTRIHRGVVVNVRAIKYRRVNDGVVTSVVLSDDTHLLVGRKFRHRLPPQTTNVLPIAQRTAFDGRFEQEIRS